MIRSSTGIRITRSTFLIAIATVVLGACASGGTPNSGAMPLSAEKITSILQSPDRSQADRVNDVRRTRGACCVLRFLSRCAGCCWRAQQQPLPHG